MKEDKSLFLYAAEKKTEERRRKEEQTSSYLKAEMMRQYHFLEGLPSAIKEIISDSREEEDIDYHSIRVEDIIKRFSNADVMKKYDIGSIVLNITENDDDEKNTKTYSDIPEFIATAKRYMRLIDPKNNKKLESHDESDRTSRRRIIYDKIQGIMKESGTSTHPLDMIINRFASTLLNNYLNENDNRKSYVSRKDIDFLNL